MSTMSELSLEFPQLMDEVKCLNEAWGWSGLKDAIAFINLHSTHYDHLASEMNEFMDQFGDVV
jgi:hypothetical protein